jgi:uncharacterized surface protein with fasciclin (FAS1) repeats
LPTPPPSPAPPKPTPVPPTPAGQKTLFDFIKSYGPLTNFSVLCGLVGQCKAKLSSLDLTTVFAPTDAGFSQHLDPATWQQLLVPANSKLRDIFLLRHLFFGDILSSALQPTQDLQALSGVKVHVTRTVTSAGQIIEANTALVTRADLICHNGVAYTVDQPIHMPVPSPGPAPSPPSPAMPTPPAPAPTPGSEMFKCINSKCVTAPTGIPKSKCASICG